MMELGTCFTILPTVNMYVLRERWRNTWEGFVCTKSWSHSMYEPQLQRSYRYPEVLGSVYGDFHYASSRARIGLQVMLRGLLGISFLHFLFFTMP